MSNASIIAQVSKVMASYDRLTLSLPCKGSVFIPGLNILVRAKFACGSVIEATAEYPSGLTFKIL